MRWNLKFLRIIIEPSFLQNYLCFYVEYYLVHGWIIFLAWWTKEKKTDG